MTSTASRSTQVHEKGRHEMASYYLAPSLRILSDEVNARWGIGWPRRGTLDGWIGDLSHRLRRSDHNPNSRGTVNAIDVDMQGIDAEVLIQTAISSRRTNYVLHRGTIWNDDVDYEPRPFGGDPHTRHVHISVKQARWAEQDTSPWGLLEGDDMHLPLVKNPSVKSQDVRRMQEMLKRLGQNIVADGYYGDQTEAAIKSLFPVWDATKVDGFGMVEIETAYFAKVIRDTVPQI